MIILDFAAKILGALIGLQWWAIWASQFVLIPAIPTGILYVLVLRKFRRDTSLFVSAIVFIGFGIFYAWQQSRQFDLLHLVPGDVVNGEFQTVGFKNNPGFLIRLNGERRRAADALISETIFGVMFIVQRKKGVSFYKNDRISTEHSFSCQLTMDQKNTTASGHTFMGTVHLYYFCPWRQLSISSSFRDKPFGEDFLIRGKNLFIVELKEDNSLVVSRLDNFLGDPSVSNGALLDLFKKLKPDREDIQALSI